MHDAEKQNSWTLCTCRNSTNCQGMTETIDVIDLHKPQDLVTLAEVFAPIEGDTIPYVDPADAYFDDEAYWNAFAEYMVSAYKLRTLCWLF